MSTEPGIRCDDTGTMNGGLTGPHRHQPLQPPPVGPLQVRAVGLAQA